MVQQWLCPPITFKAPKGRTIHLIPALFLDHLLAITSSIIFVMAEEGTIMFNTNSLTSLEVGM